MCGISYFAINQWMVAALRPPALAAICPWEGYADYYRDAVYHGGIMSIFEPSWYVEQVVRVQHGYGTRGARDPNTGELVAGPETLSDEELNANRLDIGAEIRRRRLDDKFFKDRSAELEKIEVPLLSAANWGGLVLHSGGNFAGFERAASKQKWLECHGDAHWTHFYFYTDYGRKLQLKFFDRFLKGIDNGWDDEPRVRLQIRSAGEKFEERHEAEWPLARTDWRRLYLDNSSFSLVEAPPKETVGAAYQAGSDFLEYTMAPVAETTEVTGPLAAKLYVSSETEDADLFLVVRMFDEQGQEVTFQGALDPHTPISQGWLRASHRRLDPERSKPYQPYHSHDRVEPLTPG